MSLPDSIVTVSEELTKLPSIGRKSASRLALYLASNLRLAKDLARSLEQMSQVVQTCQSCFTLAEDETCSICKDTKRNRKQICVVEETSNLFSIEDSRIYQGLYHVLGGVLSPMEGVSPDDLRIKELIARVKENEIEEIIIATNPNVEGEATAHYLLEALSFSPSKKTRIAYGMPAGSKLEFIDMPTILQALEGRREIK